MNKKLLWIIIYVCCAVTGWGQGLHFSQISSAPLFLNPSNTGLLPYDNYRVGAHYRNQWNTVPVNYTTIAAFGDLQLLKNENETSWFGLGGAFYSDRAGDGILSLSQIQLSLAYHIKTSYTSMLSIGFGGSYKQRTLDFSKLSYDVQWNGFSFDRSSPNHEPFKYESTRFWDLSAGLNYALFPNDFFYAKFGAGLLHVNRASETFYNNDNKLGFRPVASVEIIGKATEYLIVSPVLYASFQKKASDVVIGSMFSYNASVHSRYPSIFSIGVYYRWNDAVISALGYEFNKVKLLFSYDITTSGMKAANNMNGAMEFSIIYQGLYPKNNANNRGGFNCPRF